VITSLHPYIVKSCRGGGLSEEVFFGDQVKWSPSVLTCGWRSWGGATLAN